MISFNKILAIIVLSALIIAACMCVFVYNQSEQKDTNQLIVGTCSGFPPYEVLDEHGQLVGFDIDVAHELAKHMHKKLVIKDMSFDTLVLALKQNKIALAFAGISITNARLQEVALVHYQGKAFTSIPLLFWKQLPDGVMSITDLQKLPNKIVCVQAGNIEEEILGHYAFLSLKQLDAIADLVIDIKYGKSLAASVDPDVADALKQKTPELAILAVPLKPEEQTQGQGIAIEKSNKQLITQVKAIINECKRDGTLEKIEKKWFIRGYSC